MNILILGKFIPFHKGHKFLIDFALNYGNKVYILVDEFDKKNFNLKLDSKIRKKIIQEEYKNNKNLKVINIKEETYQSPNDYKDFWNYWNNIINKYVNIKKKKIEMIIGSENYVKRLGNILKIKSLILDINRKNIPISATDIRNDFLNNWNYLTNSSKKFFSKKIAIIGPESTGKTTFTKNLNKIYPSKIIEEFATIYLNNKNNKNLNYKDFKNIIKGQISLIESINEYKPYTFYDTEFLTTKVWAIYMFGKYPKILDKLILKYKPDLYILTNLKNIKIVNDKHRIYNSKKVNKKFIQLFKKELKKYKINYYELKENTWNKKLKEIQEQINEL